jgi:hypothetical protein
MTGADEIREEIAKVSSLAMTARRLLAGGKLVDLSALEERVRGVCDAVQAMPREDGQGLLDDMQSLINKLDQLTRELETRLIAFGDSSSEAPRGVGPKTY